jgi:ABC-type dipeptide/oligopeptide/nickel transport system permease component
MWAYTAKRLLSAVLIMWAVATVVFVAMRVIPAAPAEVVLGDQASQEALDAFRARTALDRPLLDQYGDFFAGLLRGDLGRSLITNAPIGEQIWSVFPYTFSLAFASLAVGALIGLPLGVLTAVRRG